MKQLPDNYFDLIITDPPYGIDVCKTGKVGIKGASKPKEYGVCEWDNSIPTEECFKEMLRVSKNQIIFGGNYMTKYLNPSSCWIVWDKDNQDSFFADCELAWTSFEISLVGNDPREYEMERKEGASHSKTYPIRKMDFTEVCQRGRFDF